MVFDIYIYIMYWHTTWYPYVKMEIKQMKYENVDIKGKATVYQTVKMSISKLIHCII